jgi:hypothetical protein
MVAFAPLHYTMNGTGGLCKGIERKRSDKIWNRHGFLQIDSAILKSEGVQDACSNVRGEIRRQHSVTGYAQLACKPGGCSALLPILQIMDAPDSPRNVPRRGGLDPM